MSALFLRRRVKLKEFQLLHTVSSKSVPKQWTNQKTPEAGQVWQAFVYSSKLAKKGKKKKKKSLYFSLETNSHY